MKIPLPSPLRRPFSWFRVYLILLGAACLWPFNFFQKNGVVRSAGELEFTNPGTAFTTTRLPLGDPEGPFTLIVRLTPRRPVEPAWIAHFGRNLASYNLLVGQFSGQFLVDIRTGGTQRRARVFLPGQVRPDTTAWLAVVYNRKVLEVFLNGVRKGSTPAHIERGAWDVSSPLVLGSHANGKFPWNGRIGAFAWFDRALVEDDLRRPEDLLRAGHAVVRYDFAASTGAVVPDRGTSDGPAPLVIPERYRPVLPSPLVPPQDYWQRGPLYRDMTANVVLFLPFGVLLAVMLRRRMTPGATVLLVFCASALLSASIEVLQAFLPVRWSSLTDLLTNTAGGVLGAVAVVREWVTALFQALRLSFRGDPPHPETPAP